MTVLTLAHVRELANALLNALEAIDHREKLKADAERESQMEAPPTIVTPNLVSERPPVANGAIAAEAEPERKKRGRKSRFDGKRLFPNPKLRGENPRMLGSVGGLSMAIILRQPGVPYDRYLDMGGNSSALALDVKKGNVVLRGPEPAPTVAPKRSAHPGGTSARAPVS